MQLDLHADTPLWQLHLGYDICCGHRPWLPGGAWLANLDLPRMRAAGLDAQIFGLVALPWEWDGFGSIVGMVRRMRQAEVASAGALRLVRDAPQLAAAVAAGRTAALLSLEGVHALGTDLGRVDWCLAQGIVSYGLSHFTANAACSPAQGWGRSATRGLTPWGHALVDHLAAQGAIIDLTHINRAGFFDVLTHRRAPVWVTHTGLSGVHPHWRNLDDAQVRALADRGGVIGIIFSRHFLGGSDLSAVVRHIQYLVRVGGAGVAALGSDFDGFVVPVRGLEDVGGRIRLAQALHDAGLTADLVDGILGANAWRFIQRTLPGPAAAAAPSPRQTGR